MKIDLYLAKKAGVIPAREEAIGGAVKAGFECHGDSVEVFSADEYNGPRDGVQLAAMIGIHSRRIFDEHIKAGRQALIVDKGYFGRDDYYRLSLDAFQPAYAHAVKCPTDRLERLKLEFRHQRKNGGKFVLYAGSSQVYCDWHSLGDATEYARSVCAKINKVFGTGNALPSTMPIVYRPKPTWAEGRPQEAQPIRGTRFSGPDERLADILPSCHAVVTHGSNAAVEAVMHGIPVLVESACACAAEPVAETDIGNLAHPRFPTDEQRRQWAANLAYCQFTFEEIADGSAWTTLHKYTIKSLEAGLAKMDEQEAVLAQYKIMHHNQKMFRGRLPDGFAEEISKRYHALTCESWLDYGCGKGLQYTEKKVHEAWDLPMPTLYDPGYPPLAKKLVGPSDAVVCIDVMEHVPEAYVERTLAEIFQYARKLVYLVIFTEAARKSLPDGRNAHLTQRPAEWWMERIRAANGRGIECVVHFKGRD